VKQEDKPSAVSVALLRKIAKKTGIRASVNDHFLGVGRHSVPAEGPGFKA
jgi:hypothetical protein